jgi:hypothetical protein
MLHCVVSQEVTDAIALIMEAVNTSETSVSFYQIIRRNTPEGSHLRIRRLENLKSHGNEPAGSVRREID